MGVLCEELLFRKYLVELGQGLGLKLWLSCLVSAVLFALWHTTAIENSWFLIVSALVYSYFTYLFKSISFTVGAHLAFNILTMFTDSAGVESNLTTNYYVDVPSEWVFSSIMFDLNLLALVLIVHSLKGYLAKWHRQRIATQNI
ncbi:CPBP family intramembrane glutamic endopeptidase [Kangiella spongicola]|uniref:CPBP family intramembrane glutamic endopeptidase n=1 Tax=Kangiella spongicola TaxID=796379 RepID=UPI0014744BE5